MSQDGLPFHLHPLEFSLEVDSMDALTSVELALVQFHPDCTDAARNKAELLFWRRRNRDTLLLRAGRLQKQEPVKSAIETDDREVPSSSPVKAEVTKDVEITSKPEPGASRDVQRPELIDVQLPQRPPHHDGTLGDEAQAAQAESSAGQITGDPAADISNPAIRVLTEDEAVPNTQDKPASELAITAATEPPRKLANLAEASTHVPVIKAEPVEDQLYAPLRPPVQILGQGKEGDAVSEEGEIRPSREDGTRKRVPEPRDDKGNGVGSGAQRKDKGKGKPVSERYGEEKTRPTARNESQKLRDGAFSKQSTRDDRRKEPAGSKKRLPAAESQARSRTRSPRVRQSTSRQYHRGDRRRQNSPERGRKRRRSYSYSSYSSGSSRSRSYSYSSDCSSSSYDSHSRSRSPYDSRRPSRRQDMAPRKQLRRTSPTPSPDRLEMSRKFRGQVSQPEMMTGRSSAPTRHLTRSPPRPVQNNYGFPGEPSPMPTSARMSSDIPKPPISIRGRSQPPQSSPPGQRSASTSGSTMYSSRPQPAKWGIPPTVQASAPHPGNGFGSTWAPQPGPGDQSDHNGYDMTPGNTYRGIARDTWPNAHPSRHASGYNHY